MAQPWLDADEIAAVTSVLQSGAIAQGPVVAALETRITEICEVRRAVAVSNGTTALHLALLALGVGAGDVVVTTPFTFVATASAALMCGARVAFADIEPAGFTLSAERVIDVSDRVGAAAVVTVDIFGQACDYHSLAGQLASRDVAMVEDSCQAFGASYDGRPTGGFGRVGCFSLYATKNVTSAEGGVLTTDDN